MQKKVEQIFFHLWIVAFEMVALHTGFYWEEYLSSGVNMLKNSLKISVTTKTEFLELISCQSDH